MATGAEHADDPTEVPARTWKAIARRVKREVDDDNIHLVAGGVAFYGFLALFPLLAAVVSTYGLVTDPADVAAQMAALARALPLEARDIIAEQMQRVAGTSDGALGIGTALALLATIWAANKGMKGLVRAMNIAYDVEETRGFFKLNAMTLALTLGAVASVVIALGTAVVLPGALRAIGVDSSSRIAINLITWPLLAALVLFGLAVLYRFAPDRRKPKWRWVSPGSLLAGLLWLAVSVGLSIYAQNFGKYNETFGALAAVAILLVWLFFTAFAILLGAELNAETEREVRPAPDE